MKPTMLTKRAITRARCNLARLIAMREVVAHQFEHLVAIAIEDDLTTGLKVCGEIGVEGCNINATASPCHFKITTLDVGQILGILDSAHTQVDAAALENRVRIAGMRLSIPPGTESPHGDTMPAQKVDHIDTEAVGGTNEAGVDVTRKLSRSIRRDIKAFRHVDRTTTFGEVPLARDPCGSNEEVEGGCDIRGSGTA